MARALLAGLLVVWGASLWAQDAHPTWFVRGEVGGAELHGTGDLSSADVGALWYGARVGAAFGRRGILAMDVGFGRGTSDGGFTTFTGGLELRAWTDSLVSPYVRLEVGSIDDRLGRCRVGGLGGGVSIRLKRSLVLRAGVLSAAHCADGVGPVGAQVGLELRW